MPNQEQAVIKMMEDKEFMTFLGWFWSNIQLVGLDSGFDRERDARNIIQSYELAGVKLALQLLDFKDRLNMDETAFWQWFVSNVLSSSAVKENEQLENLSITNSWILLTALQSYMELGAEKLKTYSVIKLKT